MSKTKKNSISKLSILGVCVIALVTFAMMTLYAMVGRPVTTPSTSDHQTMLRNTVTSLEKGLSLTSGVIAEPIVVSQNANTQNLNSITSVTPPVSLNKPQLPSIKRDASPNNAESPRAGNMSTAPNLYAVTYASHGGRDDRFCRAIESAIRHEVDLIILGWGVKWKGLSQKLEAAHNFAKGLPKDDIILFTDAFDVMFTNNPKHILETYQEMTAAGSDIIFAGECGCWPHVTIDHGRPCFDKYPKSPTPYRYLNSGTWIGKASPSAAMLHAVQLEAGKDFVNANDQELVANMFIEGRFGISLDYNAKLFQSMHLTLDRPLPYCKPIDDIEVVGRGQLHNKLTDTFPAVFHFNGGGKRYHLDLEGKLWYKKSPYNSESEMEHVRAHRLKVPIESNIDRTLRFDEICPTYFKPSGGVQSGNKKQNLYRRQDRNTPRGRSIQLSRRNREY